MLFPFTSRFCLLIVGSSGLVGDAIFGQSAAKKYPEFPQQREAVLRVDLKGHISGVSDQANKTAPAALGAHAVAWANPAAARWCGFYSYGA